VTLLAQTRIFYSMSRDDLLPAIFSKVHPTFRTPDLSTVLTGTIIALVAGLTPIVVLGQLVSIGTLLAFVLVCIGVILRKTIRCGRTAVATAAGSVLCIFGARRVV
jgi:APA family basic amino acid/polyamine antiporter